MKVLPGSRAFTGSILIGRAVGCFLGCIATFVFGENLGRRWSLAVGAIIMVVGALLQGMILFKQLKPFQLIMITRNFKIP